MSVFQFSENSALQSSGEESVNEYPLNLKNQKVHREVFGIDVNEMSNLTSSETGALRQSGVKDVFSQEFVLDNKKYVLRLLEERDDDESSLDSVNDSVASPSRLNPLAPEFVPAVERVSTLNPDAPEFKPEGYMDLEEDSFVIPPYDPSMSLQDVLDLWESLAPADQRQLSRRYGYPRWILDRVIKSIERGTPLDPFGTKAPRVKQARNLNKVGEKAGLTHSRYSLGEVSKTWVIPRSGATLVVKPQSFQPRTFKAWVYGKANALWQTVTKKSQVVTGNDACRALFFSSGSVMSDRMAQQLFIKADVYVSDFSREDREPAPAMLGSFIDADQLPQRPFHFGTFRVTCLDDVVGMEQMFRRHKPLYRALTAYYLGEPVDPNQLQSSLAKVFPIVKAEGLSDTIRSMLPCDFRFKVQHEVVVTTDWNPFETAASLAPSLAQCFVQIAGTLVAMFEARDWKGAVGALSSFVASKPLIWSYGVDRLKSIVSKVTIFNGFADSILGAIQESLGFFWETVVGCSLMSIVAELGGSAKGLIAPLISDLVGETRRTVLKESAVQMARTVVSWINDGFVRLKDAIETKSMDPLWGANWNPKLWVRQAQGLMTYYTLLTSQSSTNPEAGVSITSLRDSLVIPSYWAVPVSLTEFISRCESHHSLSVKLIAYFATKRDVVAEISREASAFQQFIDRLKLADLTSGERAAPFATYWYGPPGVGKTNLARQTLNACSNMQGFPVSGKHTYDWQVGVNFQDGLDHTTTAVVMDDVDQGVSAPTAGVPSHVESVIGLVNNKPFPVEQASVNMKGTVFASPAVLMYCSNFTDGRVKKYSLEPHAFLRRFSLYVTVKVKPEFATPDGRLDKAKATASKTHDMFELHVSTYQPSVDDPLVFLSPPRIMSFPQFLKLYHDMFSKHMADEVLNLRRRAVAGSCCPSCGLSSDRECCVLRKEGAAFSRAPELRDDEVFERTAVCGVIARLESIGVDVGSDEALRRVWKSVRDAARDPTNQLVRMTPATRNFIYSHPSRVSAIQERLFALPDLTEEDLYAHPCQFPSDPVMMDWVGVHADDTPLQRRWVFRPPPYAPYVAALVAVAGVIKLASVAFKYLENQIVVGLQGREANTTPGLVPMSWQRADQKFTPAVVTQRFGQSTYTLDQIREDVARCTVKVDRYVDGVPVFDMFCQVYGHESVVIPTHGAKVGSLLRMTLRGASFDYKVSEVNRIIFPSNPEICVLKVCELPACPSLHKKTWITDDAMIQSFDDMVIIGETEVYHPSASGVRKVGQSNVIWSSAQTKIGDCGLLYVGCHNGNWKIVGMHYASQTITTPFSSTQQSLGGIITVRELQSLMTSLATTMQGVSQVTTSMTEYPEDLEVGRFGKLSEVWAAKSHHNAHFFPIGQLNPPLPGSKMVSKIKKSIIADLFSDFEEEVCGVREYWRIPNFRGFMDGDLWNSSFTNMFAAQNRMSFDDVTMWIAIYDYLNGIGRLDGTGFRQLSEQEAIVGVPGAGISSINFKTSAGPPLKGGKRAHVAVDDGVAYMSPEFAGIWDSIESVLQNGDIPAVLSVCSLKDEPLKYTKRFARVFNNMPASFNILLKQDFGPIKQFMRANWKFFESLVGINMTSEDCNRVITYLRAVNPDLDSLFDCDATMMDKSWNGKLLSMVALVFYAIAYVMGLDAKRVWTLTHSIKHTVYSVKNDLIEIFHNPSGVDPTVEINGVGVSLGERYVYYRTHPFRGSLDRVMEFAQNFFENPCPDDDACEFRANMALVTYGDDNVKATKEDLPANYESLWKDEIGIEMLDASKTAHVSKKKLSEISLLKRKFVSLEGIDGYVAKLDLKSMARMLVMKRDSTLGDVDHAAVVCTEFLREAVYHGREFYDRMLARIKSAAVERGFDLNPYFVAPSFDERLEEVKSGAFQTWALRESVPRVSVSPSGQEETGICYQSMSSVTLAKGTDSVPTPQAAPEAVVHSTGVIQSDTATTVRTRETPRSFQSFPKTDLNAFLQRGTLIWEAEVSSADTTADLIFRIKPWELFLTNSYIEEKLNNYSYIAGTLQVIIVPTTPPMSYGAYAFSALPNGSDDALGCAPHLTYQNCLQTDHSALLDVSASNSIVFQLPYIGDTDVKKITGTGADGIGETWELNCFCLQPVNTSIPGGVVLGSVKVYANLLDDYVLTIPRFEGRVKLTPNEAMKRHAPAVHAAIGEGRGSAIAGKIADLAEAASVVPVIGPFAKTAGFVARMAETGLGWLGFTVEQNERAPQVMTLRSTSSTAHTEGEDSSYSATLGLHSELSIDPTLAGFGSEDCLATSSLFPRWTLVKTIPWSPADLAAQVLGEVPVTPSYCINTANALSLTTAGFFGFPFQLWRGDMEYMLVIPVSKAHKGKLQVIWTPTGSTVTGDVTNVSMNTIYDVTAGAPKVMSVGFARDIPFLENRLMWDGMTIVPLGAANGNLLFRVVNPLVSQNETAGTNIFVFARAKENMQFGCPRDEIAFEEAGEPVTIPFVMGITLEGAIGDSLEEPEVVDLVPASNPYPASEILFGESIGSVRELLQKPSKLNVLSLIDLRSLSMGLATPGSPVLTGVEHYWTWQGHYRSMFYGLAFSERFKVFPKEPMWVGASRHHQVGTVAATSYVPTMAPLTYTGPQYGAEFRVPYYHNRKFIRSWQTMSRIAPGPKTVLTGHTASGAAASVILYYSFGPDIRGTCFRQIPRLRVSVSGEPANYHAFW